MQEFQRIKSGTVVAKLLLGCLKHSGMLQQSSSGCCCVEVALFHFGPLTLFGSELEGWLKEVHV
jgi:hypothetical protein